VAGLHVNGWLCEVVKRWRLDVDVNFYPFHIGDYASATAHLSLIEDAAYRRLLDVYYTRETPIPFDVRQACRLVRAQSKDERQAVEDVLREFFTETPDGWRHGRCDAEIAKANEKKTKAAQSALKRWGNAPAMPTHPEGDANAYANAMRTHMPTQCEGNAPNPNPNPNPNPKGKEHPPTPRKRGAAAPLPDWLNPDDWQAFREHRTRLRKPMTAEAERRNLVDLEKLRAEGHEPAAVINQSLVRGWVGLFRIKDDSVTAPMSRQAALEARNAEHAREFARRIMEQAQNAAATDGQ
jgi:uncharacterized protein YdaU (DUF1376 family)